MRLLGTLVPPAVITTAVAVRVVLGCRVVERGIDAAIVIVLCGTRVRSPTRIGASILITLLTCAELGVQLYVWGVTAVVAGARSFIVSGGAAHTRIIHEFVVTAA